LLNPTFRLIYNHSKFHFIIAEANLVLTVANITIEIELIGIKIAATTGSKLPLIAKDNPITLYKKLIINAIQINRIDIFENFKKTEKTEQLSDFTMASHEGEKLFTSSVKTNPTSLCCIAPASFNPSPNIKTL